MKKGYQKFVNHLPHHHLRIQNGTQNYSALLSYHSDNITQSKRETTLIYKELIKLSLTCRSGRKQLV